MVTKTNKDQDFEDWIRAKSCLINNEHCETWTGNVSEFAHVKHSGMGGVRVPSIGNGVPLCTIHHTAGKLSQHTMGRTSFEQFFRVALRYKTLAEHAGALAMAYRLEQTGLGE